MAVDTASKRFSMMRFGQTVGLLPIPDGTIGSQDRAHLLGLYAGLALQAPELAVIGFILASITLEPPINVTHALAPCMDADTSLEPAIKATIN